MAKDVFDNDNSENFQKFLPLSFLNDKSERSCPILSYFCWKTGLNQTKIAKSPQYNTRIINNNDGKNEAEAE